MAKKRANGAYRQAASSVNPVDSNSDSSDQHSSESSESGDASSSDEETEWDKILGDGPQNAQDHAADDIDITIDEVPSADQIAQRVDAKAKKYAPSKREKAIRTATHVMHVQALLFHNYIRNRWCEDVELQRILVDGLSEGCKQEIERWRKGCGHLLPDKAALQVSDQADTKPPKKGSRSKSAKQEPRAKSSQREWGYSADRLEQGQPDLSHGDGTLRMLKVLSACWRKRFVISAPGVRRRGYKHIRRLATEYREFQDGKTDIKLHGERVASLQDFREAARTCRGSRDVGAQLFTALLRGIGLETRLVSNLQALGYGWTKFEEAEPWKPQAKKSTSDPNSSAKGKPGSSSRRTNAQILSAESAKKKTSARASRSKATGKDQQDAIALTDSESELSSPPSSDDGSVVDVTPAKPIESARKYDRDLPYPVYWTEVFSPVKNQWLAVDPLVLSVIASNPDSFSIFEPSGARAAKVKQNIGYVLAHASDHTVKDVTVRYLKKHVWPGKTKGARMPAEKIPIYNSAGKVRRHEYHDWFKHLLSVYARRADRRTVSDDVEDEHDLKPLGPQKDAKGEAKGESLQWYKQSAEFVLERHLRREEAILPGSKVVRQFTTGKGDNVKTEPVFKRSDVVNCRTVESWHKEGREVIEGEEPLKWVPIRAVTAIRKQQIAMAERDMGGEKMQQGLYAEHQTDWIIPPPIEDGVIPKNAYGNMDCFVPTMVPEGAIHIPMRGTAKVCKKLNIDFAEACTGFEFGNRMAVPVLTGVVVAQENEHAVLDAWKEDQAEQRRKEKIKEEKQALVWWKKMHAGLKVLHRMRTEYGHGADQLSSVQQSVRAATQGVAKPKKRAGKVTAETVTSAGRADADAAESKSPANEPGGFLADDAEDTSGGYVPDEASPPDASDLGGGGFLLDEEHDEPKPAKKESPAAPRGLAALMNHDPAKATRPDGEQDDFANGDMEEPPQGSPAEAADAESSKELDRAHPASVPAGRKKKAPASDPAPAPAAKGPTRRARGRRSALEAEPEPEQERAVDASRRRSGRAAAQKADTGAKSKYFESSDEDMAEV